LNWDGVLLLEQNAESYESLHRQLQAVDLDDENQQRYQLVNSTRTLAKIMRTLKEKKRKCGYEGTNRWKVSATPKKAIPDYHGHKYKIIMIPLVTTIYIFHP
jgi:hypothetical protein